MYQKLVLPWPEECFNLHNEEFDTNPVLANFYLNTYSIHAVLDTLIDPWSFRLVYSITQSIHIELVILRGIGLRAAQAESATTV